MLEQPKPVPVRTIAVTIGMVLATLIGLYLVITLARIEALLLVGAFFAVVLTPPVNWMQRHLHFPFPARASDTHVGKSFDQWVDKNKAKIQDGVTPVGTGAISVVRTLAVAVAYFSLSDWSVPCSPSRPRA